MIIHVYTIGLVVCVIEIENSSRFQFARHTQEVTVHDVEPTKKPAGAQPFIKTERVLSTEY